MPTQLQQRVFKKTMVLKKEKKPISIRKIMIEEGAGIEYARKPQEVTGSKGWQQLLAKYDDAPILEAVYNDALDKNDKRNATANRKMYFDLKDLFPAQKSKVLSLFADLDSIEE